MSSNEGPAAPASGTSEPEIPSFEELAADPEIAALLDFEPVPMRPRVNGWDPDAQRAFIALFAITGSKLHAAKAAGRTPGGIDRMLKRPDADGFRDAFDRALDLFRRSHAGKLADSVAAVRKADPGIQAPGQVINEFGEYEDEASLHRRADEARDNVAGKLLKLRRLYLQEISTSPGKRAAFEILSDFDVDWDKAERCEPQGDEPYATPSMRDPQFLLTAEAGWMGHMARGPDKVAELRAAIDEHREAEGLPPVEWGESTEDSEQA